MFDNQHTFDAWENIKKLYRDGNLAGFEQLLQEKIQTLAASRDEIRLLFYVGKECDEHFYRSMLKHIESWKMVESEDKDMRCSTFLYAVEYSLPPSLKPHKHYMAPLFIETTGFRLEK